MKSIQDQYLELLGLTREYLQLEHQLNDRLFADSETYTYFRDYVIRKGMAQTKQVNQVEQPKQNQTVAPLKPVVPVSQPLSTGSKFVAPKEVVLSKDIVESVSPLETPSEIKKSEQQPKNKQVPDKFQDEKKSEVKSRLTFVMEKPEEAEALDLSEIRKIVSDRCPSIHVLDRLPSDEEGRRKARDWEQGLLTQVLIISGNDNSMQTVFQENLRFALDVNGWNAKIYKEKTIEANKTWGSRLESQCLQLVISTREFIETVPELKKLVQETEPGKYCLENVPLILLADPSAYAANPSLKSDLWKSIKDLLAKKRM